MSLLARSLPMTPLDALRALMGSFSEGKEFDEQLTALLEDLRQQAIPELGERLLRGTTSRGLKRAILRQLPSFDWPEWGPILLQLLLQEQDLGVFDAGCAGLGVLFTTESVDALRKIQVARGDPERQAILRRELETGATQHPKAYFFARLGEGKGNPRHARNATKALASLVAEEDLPVLSELLQREDDLVRRLTLKLLATLPGDRSGAVLMAALGRALEELEQLNALESLLERLQDQGRGQARDEILRALSARFAAKGGEVLTTLNLEAAEEGGDPSAALERLLPLVDGPFESFLASALESLFEGKVARFAALQSEMSEFVLKRPDELSILVDELAEILTFRIQRGLPPPEEEALAFLKRCHASGRGGDGVVLGLARLAEPEDTESFDLLLADPIPRRRVLALDALGARELDASVPCFIRALGGHGREAERAAIRHLGRLPSGFERVMDLFRTKETDKVRLAIHVFAESRTWEAGEALLSFMLEEASDELVLDAARALGSIAYTPAVPDMLGLLHDGKPHNLQIALAEALGAMANPDASLGLLDRAPHLKAPKVLLACLQGSITAFPSFSQALPTERIPDLEAIVERCWDEREGEGHRVDAMLALQNLYTFDLRVYERLKDRFSDYLTEMRFSATWDRQLNDRVSGIVKELARRAVNLSRLEEREGALLGLLGSLPRAGQARIDGLLRIRDALRDPELVLREPTRRRLAEFLATELGTPGKDWRELALLCEAGGLTHQEGLVQPIRDTLLRATGVGLRAAAREALLNLGVAEGDIDRRAPIKSLLLLEPSAFFRKRLVGALEAKNLSVLQAATRSEAQEILSRQGVDLVVSEFTDAEGGLQAWLEAQWQGHRTRHVLLATASRDLGPVLDAPWLLGVIYKPFPVEQLLQAIET